MDVAWLLAASGACIDAVVRLGRCTWHGAHEQATESDREWLRAVGAGAGHGDGAGAGYGAGSGYGAGYGAGYGDEAGDGSGSGDGAGVWDGDGYYGAGYGDESGDGFGSGDGYGDEAGDESAIVELVMDGRVVRGRENARAWLMELAETES